MVTPTGERTTVGPVTIRPGDPRYLELTTAANGRFRCRPRQVRVVGSTAQVVEAVQDAVRGGMRVVARSGGHCLEDFVDSPDTGLLIDLSELHAVGYDPGRRAFFAEPGALLGDVYRTLLKGWGSPSRPVWRRGSGSAGTSPAGATAR